MINFVYWFSLVATLICGPIACVIVNGRLTAGNVATFTITALIPGVNFGVGAGAILLVSLTGSQIAFERLSKLKWFNIVLFEKENT